jgi:CRISPR-associated protein Csc3
MEVHPEEFYTPLLYLPDGVVYLASSDAAVDVTSITTQIIAKIKTLCAERLKKRQTGFSRDGKGFKFADYYWLFFSLEQFMKVSVDAACRIIPSTNTNFI